MSHPNEPRIQLIIEPATKEEFGVVNSNRTKVKNQG
jgi:hypothetical protein